MSDVQPRKWVGVVVVKFKLWHRRTLTEEAGAASSVFDSFPDFPNPLSDVPIVEDGIVEKD